jgi:hypothetical protein
VIFGGKSIEVSPTLSGTITYNGFKFTVDDNVLTVDEKTGEPGVKVVIDFSNFGPDVSIDLVTPNALGAVYMANAATGNAELDFTTSKTTPTRADLIFDD